MNIFFMFLRRWLICDRHSGASRQILLLELTALITLARCFNHLSYPGGPNFFECTNFGRFDLVTSLSKQVVFGCYRQMDGSTDRQAGNRAGGLSGMQEGYLLFLI